MNTDQIRINEQSSIRIAGSGIIYADPFHIKEEPHDADMICLTHEHFDHFDPESIEKIRKEDTVFAAPSSMQKELEKLVQKEKIRLLLPGDSFSESFCSVGTLPSYNRMKPFHPKHSKNLGYLITMDGIRYYIAGDTDNVKELQHISCDIALIPIGGTYTMNAKEAASLANSIHPDTVIPTHYGTVVGKKEDAAVFRDLVEADIEVVIKL